MIACGPPSRDESGGDDDDGNGDGPSPPGECAQGTELIYVVDQFANRISQFDPSTKTFVDLGQLTAAARCHTSSVTCGHG